MKKNYLMVCGFGFLVDLQRGWITNDEHGYWRLRSLLELVLKYTVARDDITMEDVFEKIGKTYLTYDINADELVNSLAVLRKFYIDKLAAQTSYDEDTIKKATESLIRSMKKCADEITEIMGEGDENDMLYVLNEIGSRIVGGFHRTLHVQKQFWDGFGRFLSNQAGEDAESNGNVFQEYYRHPAKGIGDDDQSADDAFVFSNS